MKVVLFNMLLILAQQQQFKLQLMNQAPNIFARQEAPPTRLSMKPKPSVNRRKFQVICRVRPQHQQDLASDLVINEEKASIAITSDEKRKKKEFTFHKIYNDQTSQQKFTCQIVDQIFKASQKMQDSLVLAYGVTNSGKTYTILGTEDEPGLLPVLLERIFEKFPEDEVQLTAIESYNDDIYSLKDRVKLYSKEVHGQFEFQDFKPEVATRETLRQMVRNFHKNRAQTTTDSNKKSSRSHAIFKIICPSISVAIVDLAGSQRIKKANTNFLETTSINSTLLVLGKCIHAFRDGNVVPFRESKLTRILAQYFNQRYKIFMLTHVNRSGQMFHENVNVLQYAAISTNVKHLNPHLNKTIMKSLKKNQLMKSRSISCLKNKPKTITRVFQKQKWIEKQDPEQEEEDQLLKAMKIESENRKKEMMERYIHYQLGYWDAVNQDLQREFAQLDRKDKAMIEEWKKINWQTPKKDEEEKMPIQIQKASTRIKLRKQILQELEKQKQQNRIDIAIGTSQLKSQPKNPESDQLNGPEIPINPNEQDYITQQEEPSFFQKVVASSQKLVSIKGKVNQYVNSAINIIKSYSHKKEKQQREKEKNERINRPLAINNFQLNWCIQSHAQKLDVQFEQVGCGSQKIDEDEKEYMKNFSQAYHRIPVSIDSQDSQLLDSTNHLDDKQKQQNNQQETKQKPEQNLTQIRQSQEYFSPFFADLNKGAQKIQNHVKPEVQLQKQIENVPQHLQKNEESDTSPIEHRIKNQKEQVSKNTKRVPKIEQKPQKHPYLRKNSKIPAKSVNKETKATKKHSESSSVMSFDQDSNSTLNINPKHRKGNKSNDSRHPMQFKVCKSISPLQTRAQRSKKATQQSQQ